MRPLVAAALLLLMAGGAAAQQAEQHDMRLVGQDDLQARSAYQPVIQRQGNRWIAYVGHHGGRRLNPLTGQMELNGTSIVDVTDPSHPRYLHHIPGAAGEAEAGGALIDDVIDPRETRPVLVRALEMASTKKVERPWKKHGVMPV